MIHFIFLFAAFLPFHLDASDPAYEITYQRGKIEILREGKIVPPPVMTGDRIRVSKGGLAVLKGQGEVIKIMGDTIITPKVDKEGTLIDLVKGAVMSLVTKKNFQIKAPAAVFAVRGTQFFVSANGASDAWMCVNEGIVNVNKKNKLIDVPAGKGVFVDDKEISKPKGVFVDDKEISKPKVYAWTKKINWKMDKSQGELDHKIDLNYDLLENFYD